MLTNLLSKISKPIALVLLVSCFLLFNCDCFSQQEDKWHQQELDYGTSNTWLYIALGVLAAGTIAYFVFKPSSSDDSSAQKKKNSDKSKVTKSDSTKTLEQDTTAIKKSIKTDK